MRIGRIEHVQLAMPPGREDEARAFYRGVLGFTEVPKPPDLAKRGGAWFEGEGAKIHLGVDARFVASAKAHVALLVEDLAAWLDTCRASGARVVDDDAPMPGWRRAYVYDPFGNRIELMEADGSSP
jgi:catechol 2,3-dioxygenase-like lactoylglutathione lyase family enzyme